MATREHWDIDPNDERAMWLKLISQEKENPEETKRIAEQIFEGRYGSACLEVGAGVGRLLVEAAKRFDLAAGVDSSPSIVEAAQRYLRMKPRCIVTISDGFLLSFPDNFFDFVYSFTCFQHMTTLREIQSNIHEIYRVLKPSGECRIQTVMGENGKGLYDGHVFSSADDFSFEFMNVGFKTVTVTSDDGVWLWASARKS